VVVAMQSFWILRAIVSVINHEELEDLEELCVGRVNNHYSQSSTIATSKMIQIDVCLGNKWEQ
jgi:hypothetical protein